MQDRFSSAYSLLSDPMMPLPYPDRDVPFCACLPRCSRIFRIHAVGLRYFRDRTGALKDLRNDVFFKGVIHVGYLGF